MMYKFLLFHVLACLGSNGCSRVLCLSPRSGSHRPIIDRPTGNTPSTPSGQFNPVGHAIIHGEEAPDKSMPYMASVQNNKQHVCGGFLIHEDFVVTAAQCDVTKEKASVVLGTNKLQTVMKKGKYIIKMCKHPSYQKNGWNDIMLLKLRGGERQNFSAKPVPLPTSVMNIEENEECQVAGWGVTEPGGQFSATLSVVNVSVINQQVCKDQLPGLPDNVICAGGYDTDKGICRGDSGGPLVCNGVAVGVASFNKSTDCNYPGVPNVYTNISKYLPWINNILEKKDC